MKQHRFTRMVLRVFRTTSIRRPLVLAIAVLILCWGWFPRSTETQQVELLDDSGMPVQQFELAIDDPNLLALIDKLDRAAWKAKPNRPTQYYTAKFDAELAAFYANDGRWNKQIGERRERRGQVSQVAYVVGKSLAAEPKPAFDWEDYWLKRGEQANLMVTALANVRRGADPMERVRLGGIIAGRLTVIGFAFVLILAAAVWWLVERFGCRPAPARLMLSCNQIVRVPHAWFRTRRSYFYQLRSRSRWDILEVSTILVLTGSLCL